MNIISNKTLSVVAGLLLSVSMAACGDDDQVNPSNPDASATGDAKSDASRADSAADASKDGAKEPGDAGEGAHSEAEAAQDSATGATDAEGDSPAE